MDHTKRLACIPVALALAILCLASPARAQNKILYTTETNPAPPGVTAGANSYDPGQTWASQVCGTSDVTKGFPFGNKIEWGPVLDPGQDAEGTLAAVSGTVAYNPQPGESGFCQGGTCPGQPISCSGNSFDCFGACGGFCDLSQGPSCAGGSCPSAWTDPQVGSPIACVNDGPCAACGGTCGALGRSRGDLQFTHPFGFDYDVAIAPDQAYLSLLSPGNNESIHLDTANDSTGQTAESGFEDVVYPYIHATTATGSTSLGWCTPDFKTRCSSSAECPSGETCEGAIHGLGLDPTSLPGTLGMETDHDLIPDAYQPHDGDRVAVFGRWIVDCGHGDNGGIPGWHTEIHPPLLVASGRSTGSGEFGANCSSEETCSSLIGRPFLISQQFGDGAFAKHLENELEKLGCLEVTGPAVSGITAAKGFAGLPDCDLGLDAHCVCNGDLGCEACEVGSCALLDACFAGVPFTCGTLPFGAPCTTQLEERAKIDRVPFAGTQDMQYYVQPASGRQHAGDRMLAKWQVWARKGVNVALSNGGDAGVLVDVTLDHSKYHAASLPSRQDWVVDPGEIYPSFSPLGVVELFAILIAPIQSIIIDQGLFADRFGAPQVPSTALPITTFADQLDPAAQAADVDDTQPFPVSGKINVGWFRCSPGGPYVAECTGPTTTVNLSGVGSDPDGNTVSFSWSGGFVGGSTTGQMASVQFPGPTAASPMPVTSAVNLTVADTQTSTMCSTTAKIQDTTAPVIAITQPASTTYVHSATLTLNYTVTDPCTGVKSFTPTLDGSTMLAGHGLQSMQMIQLLTELALGPHTFSISAVDNAGNADASSVTFTIIVTPDSIKNDVKQFLAAGKIKNNGIANSLLAKLDAAAKARTGGNCGTAANIYGAFINELNAQSGKGVDATAAAIMIADAQYLIAHCP